MTDLPAEAVEAAARAMSVHWRDMHTNEALGRQRMLAEAALTAAAPHIAAQADDLTVRVAVCAAEYRYSIGVTSGATDAERTAAWRDMCAALDGWERAR